METLGLFVKKLYVQLFSWKTVAVGSMLSYFSASYWVFAVAAYFIIADFFTAIIVAKHRKEEIKSNLIWKTPCKLAIAVIVFFGLRLMDIVIQSNLSLDIHPIFQLAVLFPVTVILGELKSLDETFSKFFGYSFFAKIEERFRIVFRLDKPLEKPLEKPLDKSLEKPIN